MPYFLIQGMLDPCEDSASFCWSGEARSRMEAIDFFREAAAQMLGLTQEEVEDAVAEGEGPMVCHAYSSATPITLD